MGCYANFWRRVGRSSASDDARPPFSCVLVKAALSKMHSDEVVAVLGDDDYGDDVDASLSPSGDENAPPKHVFMHSPTVNDALMRPMTAGSTAMSELEEVTLGSQPASPLNRRISSGGDRGMPLSTPLRDSHMPDRISSPASSEAGLGIPSLDEGSERVPESREYLPPRPGRGDFLAIGPSPAPAPLEDDECASPTDSEKARAEKGCLVM